MNRKFSKTTKEKFREKVGLDWQWLDHKNKWGYGKIRINKKTYLAHRISYLIYNGEIPDGMCVLHSCDNPSCVFPEHLHLGTHADNMRERADRNRNKYQNGEKNSSAKLNKKQVIEIRKKAELGISRASLAQEYGINVGHVRRIVKRISWNHI